MTESFKCFFLEGQGLRSLRHFRFPRAWGGVSRRSQGMWFFPAWMDQKRLFDSSSGGRLVGPLPMATLTYLREREKSFLLVSLLRTR